MDFRGNLVKEKVEKLIFEKMISLKAEFSIKEDVNQENVKTIVIDIDSENSLGLIIIYEDGYIYFDCLDKNDETMSSKNWSVKFSNLEEMLNNFSEFLMHNIQ